MEKLKSRKFWLAVAAFLASIGSSVAGLVSHNEILATVGIACTVVSAAIYAAAEAYVDGKSAESQTISIMATSTSKDLVEKALAGSSLPTEETPKE